MKTSSGAGKRSSRCEVVNVSPFGVWLLHGDNEYFLPHTKYPWFKKAKVEDVLNVKIIRPKHLYWPALDVDLHLESITNPEHYPLIARGKVVNGRFKRTVVKKAA